MPADARDATKDTRGYIKLALDFLENPKTGPLSPVTKLKLIELWIHCARNRTDGVVSATQARRLVPGRIREVFTIAGCWHHHPCAATSPCQHGACTPSAPCGHDYFSMHDYTRHQTLYGEAVERPKKDTRGYLKLSLDFLENRKTGPLSPVTKLKLIELWIHCARNRTNGMITAAQARKIAPPRIRDALTTAGSWQHHDCTTATPCRHGACTADAPCGHGFFTMHDYRRHQTCYLDLATRSEQARSAGRKGGLAKAANRRGAASETASVAARAPASNADASHNSQVINTSPPVGLLPYVSDAREEKRLPPPRPAPRPRHGGDDVADRLNAAAPEIPATAAMRRRVLARLVPDAVEVLADPDAGAIRHAHARAELDRAEAVIEARAEYLATTNVVENPDIDRLFDPHGPHGYARRMAAAHTPLPTPDPQTPGEVRAMAYRMARDHIDAIARQGGNPPGPAREALRAELEALLGEGHHQDRLGAELRAMGERGMWAASKLRERLVKVPA
ncbi:hypothetical protein [Nocardia brasiliensis]|uniref:hypothetical protein n=1 Tax=Nocardia brasiliensis TaxID=37326 RepID=UPI002453FA82|nr:hypothetical protein [Nocardia brasiliensis]